MLKEMKVSINNKKIIMDILSNSYKYIEKSKNSIGKYFDLQTCERLISNELSHSFKIYLEKINLKKENNDFVFSELLISIDEITKFNSIIKKFNILNKWSIKERMYADIGIFLKGKNNTKSIFVEIKINKRNKPNLDDIKIDLAKLFIYPFAGKINFYNYIFMMIPNEFDFNNIEHEWIIIDSLNEEHINNKLSSINENLKNKLIIITNLQENNNFLFENNFFNININKDYDSSKDEIFMLIILLLNFHLKILDLSEIAIEVKKNNNKNFEVDKNIKIILKLHTKNVLYCNNFKKNHQKFKKFYETFFKEWKINQ